MPWSIRVCKINGSTECFCDFLMASKLASIVRCDGQHVFLVREKQPYSHIIHIFRILSLRQPYHKEVVFRAFAQGQYGTLLSLPYDKIHFPISKTTAVGFCRPVVYACSVWNIAHLGLPDNFDMMPVFQFMAVMVAESTAFVTPYPLVNCLMGDIFRFHGEVTGNLPGDQSSVFKRCKASFRMFLPIPLFPGMRSLWTSALSCAIRQL